MKYRNGFVSNSSSSSFVVAVPTGSTLVGQLEDLMVNGEWYGENEVTFCRTEKNEPREPVVGFMTGVDEVEERLMKLFEETNSDLDIYEIDVDYHSEGVNSFFRENLRKFVIDSWD